MKKNLRILVLLALLSMTLSAFAGCTADNVPQDRETISFTDALGRAVTVQKQPERVAALIGSFADIWVLSGGSLCAAAEDAWDDFGLELPEAVSIGGAHSPNLELLLAADPEFVLASASTASNVEMQQILEAAGITVAYFDVDNFEDYLAMLEICTDITGREDLFEKNGSCIQTQIAAIRNKVADTDLPEDQRTILLLRTSSGFVKAKGSEGTILGEMLADLGCINIADSDRVLLETLSVESVIRQNPHRIFVVTMGDDTEKAMESLHQMMQENPAWGTLEAVEENRLHLMERRLFNIKPNARWAEAYEQLGEILLG